MTPPRLLETRIPEIFIRMTRTKSMNQIAREDDMPEEESGDDEIIPTSESKNMTDFSQVPVIPKPAATLNTSNMRSLLTNLASRIPDEREIAHRILARSQIVQIVS